MRTARPAGDEGQGLEEEEHGEDAVGPGGEQVEERRDAEQHVRARRHLVLLRVLDCEGEVHRLVHVLDVAGKVGVDLDYVLDSNAVVDMNVVMTSEGSFVEVQGTGEEATYTRDELDSLLNAAVEGIEKLHQLQTSLLEGLD